MSTARQDQDRPPRPPAVGTDASDFRLAPRPAPTRRGTTDASDFRLPGLPGDWRPICSDQLALYQEFLPHIEGLRAVLIGISVDSVWSHRAFSRDRGLAFPLLADFGPKGAVARAYGVYRSEDSTSERALVLIDGDGIVCWSYVAPMAVDPGVDGMLAARERLCAERTP